MLGNNIRKIREENDISQRELGEVLHVTKQTISNWENGKSYPDLQTLVAISNRYGVSLDVMLKEDLELIAEIDRQRKAARRRIRIGVVVLLLIVIAGLHMTETGALRASAFFYSPISTFTMVYEKLGEDEGYFFLIWRRKTDRLPNMSSFREILSMNPSGPTSLMGSIASARSITPGILAHHKGSFSEILGSCRNAGGVLFVY